MSLRIQTHNNTAVWREARDAIPYDGCTDGIRMSLTNAIRRLSTNLFDPSKTNCVSGLLKARVEFEFSA